MIGIDDQNKLFERIGEKSRQMKVLVIGGSAMLYYSFSKMVTKDIDLVFLSDKDRKNTVGVLRDLGFRTRHEPAKLGEPHILELGEYRLDLFSKSIFRFRISRTVLGRVREKVRYGNLELSVISPEDIFLSKSATDRSGDREDAMDIIRESNIDWNVILGECKWQAENADFRFCVYLYDFLDELVHDFGLKIPREVKRKIKEIYRDFLEKMGDRSVADY